MALDTNSDIAPYEAPEKDLYEVGEIPPWGYVPKVMAKSWSMMATTPLAGNTSRTRLVVCCQRGIHWVLRGWHSVLS